MACRGHCKRAPAVGVCMEGKGGKRQINMVASECLLLHVVTGPGDFVGGAGGIELRCSPSLGGGRGQAWVELVGGLQMP